MQSNEAKSKPNSNPRKAEKNRGSAIAVDEYGIPIPPSTTLRAMINDYNAEQISAAESSGRKRRQRRKKKPVDLKEQIKIAVAKNDGMKTTTKIERTEMVDQTVELVENSVYTQENAVYTQENAVYVEDVSVEQEQFAIDSINDQESEHSIEIIPSDELEPEFEEENVVDNLPPQACNGDVDDGERQIRRNIKILAKNHKNHDAPLLMPTQDDSIDSLLTYESSILNTSLEAMCSEHSLRDVSSVSDSCDLEVDARRTTQFLHSILNIVGENKEKDSPKKVDDISERNYFAEDSAMKTLKTENRKKTPPPPKATPKRDTKMVPKWKDFKKFSVIGRNILDIGDAELVIEVKERKENIKNVGGYRFKAIYVSNPGFKRQNKYARTVMGESPVVLLRPEATDTEIRQAIYVSVKRILATDANYTRKKTNKGDEREPVCYVSVPYLKTEGILVLRKQRIRFPRAVYYCSVCDYHLSNTAHCKKHIMTDNEHMKERYNRRLLENLLYLPPPPLNQCLAMTSALKEVDELNARTPATLIQCTDMADMISDILRHKVDPEMYVRVYGSCQTGFALEGSNLNLEIVFTSKMNHAHVLLRALNVLQEEEQQGNVVFQNPQLVYEDVKWPYVTFVSAEQTMCKGIEVKLSCRNEQAYFVGRLIRCYVDLWPHLPILARCFRVWAKMNDLDDYHAKMSLPPYAFDLMLIHFLQQKDVLPVLHEIDETGNPAKQNPVKPHNYVCEPDIVHKAFPIRQDQELGRLWIDLFRFYGIECNTANWVVQIRSKKPVSRESKGWGCKKLGIEDPFLERKNLGSMPVMMWDYFCRALALSCTYFCTPQTVNGPLFALEDNKWKVALRPISRSNSPDIPDVESLAISKKDEKSEGNAQADEKRCEEVKDVLMELLDGMDLDDESNPQINENERAGIARKNEEQDGSSEGNESEKDEDEGNCKPVQYDTALIGAALKLSVEHFSYIFEPDNFCDIRAPKPECKYCGHVGHLSKNCHEKVLPPLEPLPPMNREYLELINRMIYYEKSQWEMGFDRINFQERFVADLQEMIRKEGFTTAELNLFGSSVNGFGFRDSDLDLCMTLEGEKEMPDDLDAIKTIKQISKLLFRSREFTNVMPVTKAKVPIVKFYNIPQRCEGDISLYNCLALRNTQLLQLYASLDPRVQTLGVYIKVFAKSCGIGDASRGSLSSYAYVMLLLHYLQHTNPPVLPILQEMSVPEDCSAYLIDGWNTYFFDNVVYLKNLPRQRPELLNQQSAAELLVGFIRYYTEEFDFDRQVVQIRQSAPLTKFEKMWNEKPMAIEDPFDLNHNLAAGLSRRMYMHIRKSFVRARSVLANCETTNQLLKANLLARGWHNNVPRISEYYFCNLLPLDEELPTDRQCRVCGHVGHMADRCPANRKNQRAAQTAMKDGHSGSSTPPAAQRRNDRNDRKTPRNEGEKRDGDSNAGRRQRNDSSSKDKGRPLRGRDQRGPPRPPQSAPAPLMQPIFLPNLANSPTSNHLGNPATYLDQYGMPRPLVNPHNPQNASPFGHRTSGWVNDQRRMNENDFPPLQPAANPPFPLHRAANTNVAATFNRRWRK